MTARADLSRLDDLRAGEVHLHYLDFRRPLSPAVLEAWGTCLTPDERRRRARYVFEDGKLEYLLTRAVCRVTLSRYAVDAGVEPGEWRFKVNAFGRPQIVWPDLPSLENLRFNLSNTKGLVAIALTWDHPVGLDVEWIARRGETVEIADHYFAPTEARALRSLPAGAQKDRFFAYWTLKEAYIKARGVGLAIPLDRFFFDVQGDAQPPRIGFDPRLVDDPAAWQFARRRPLPEHVAALGVRRGRGPDLRVVESWVLEVPSPSA